MPEDCVPKFHVTLRIATAHGDVADRFHMAEGRDGLPLAPRACFRRISLLLSLKPICPPELRLENDEELYRGSLYQLLQEQRGIRPARVVQQITAAAADKEARGPCCGRSSAHPLILIKRQAL